ncbi:alpha/beta hydrolase [Candidatus Pristimantibacillus sp. PTI5]|uniref:alpha/beta hydrolase n=1 Tax=Candidatus Pristimantibacillus sp. PTI5 TaxID=3400422 RepID=UPI003B020553
MKRRRLSVLLLTGGLTISLLGGCNTANSTDSLVLAEQGNFSAGGTVITSEGTFDSKNPFDPAGQTLHGDHADVFYQIPEDANEYPLVFLHGAGQSKRSWQKTPDGREGFQDIFLKRGFGVYLVDQPRRGDAGQSTVPEQITPATSDQMWATQFRIGRMPNFYPGVQFPQDEESMDQFYRWMTPNTGAYDEEVISDAMSAVFDESGPGILVTHSQAGAPGWKTAMKNDNVHAIVAYEPAAFLFPEGEAPEPIPNRFSQELPGLTVPVDDFKQLTEIPIVVYYGDNIPEQPSDVPAEDFWRASLEMANRWAEVVNSHGGDVTIVHLPDKGITGNTHFPFADLNNVEVADQLSSWLAEKELD